MTMVTTEEGVCWATPGVNVVPAFVVFHTPPAATPMYQVFLSRGFTARSVMRPETMPGPIERRRMPFRLGPAFAVSGLSPRVVSWLAARRLRVVSVASARVRPESLVALRGGGAGW